MSYPSHLCPTDGDKMGLYLYKSHRTYTSKRNKEYQRSLLTPTTKQSSNPLGLLQIAFFHFFSPHQLAVNNMIVMGGHKPSSHKKKNRGNSSAVLASSTNLQWGHPPPPLMPESPSRHDNNGDLVKYSLVIQTPNSLPSPVLSFVMTSELLSVLLPPIWLLLLQQLSLLLSMLV
jgi:hypothetical protein